MAAKKKTKKQRPAKRSTTKGKTAKKRTAKRKAAATKPAPKAGAVIERMFKGTKHVVQVTASGYAYKGTEHRSLTAVAKAITGYAAVSGPRFFGTDKAAKKGGDA